MWLEPLKKVAVFHMLKCVNMVRVWLDEFGTPIENEIQSDMFHFMNG